MTSELLAPGSACVCKGPSCLGESSGADASCSAGGPALRARRVPEGRRLPVARSGGSGWELRAMGRRREGRGGKTGMPGDRDGDRDGVRGDRAESPDQGGTEG